MVRFLGVLTIAILSFVVARPASADVIVPGTTIVRLYDSYGTTGGGEFNGQIVGTDPEFDFISFCLETNEYFSPGQDLLVQDVSDGAKMGGVAGGNPDPISLQTAYLFEQFALSTLVDYAFGSTGSDRVTDANSLQRAFWYLEQEAAFSTLDAQAQAWVSEATTAVTGGWTDAGDNVRVLNLLRRNSQGQWVNAQDQLYYVRSVPEPATAGLLMFGFAAFGWMKRSRRV